MPLHKALTLCFVAVLCTASFAEEDKANWDVNAPSFSSQPIEAVLDTREGTWMSLDISPDGKAVVFESLGELYIKRGSDAPKLLNPDHDVRPGLYILDIDSGKTGFVSKRGTHPHFGPDRRLYAQERAETASGRGSRQKATAGRHHG